MKKQTSRVLMLLTVILTLAVVFGMTASAKTVTSGDFIFETTSSGAVLTKYNGTATSVDIPSKVTELSYGCFRYCSKLKTVKFSADYYTEYYDSTKPLTIAITKQSSDGDSAFLNVENCTFVFP